MLCAFDATSILAMWENLTKSSWRRANHSYVNASVCQWSLLHILPEFVNWGDLKTLLLELDRAINNISFIFFFKSRTPTFLHPCAVGVSGKELWWVPGKERWCGAYTWLEADPDSDGGGALQACSRHPAGFHVGLILITPWPLNILRFDCLSSWLL